MEAGTGLVDDLAALSNLDEATLQSELELRYKAGQIYTYIGDILVAVNPFENLPIYDEIHSKLYRNIKVLSKQKPHIYAVADRVYRNLITNHEPQCCIVSGESGAGKTETTKLLIRQIVQLCPQTTRTSSSSSNLHDALIEVNPLMEAFGNAKTTLNENSSRFGKYIELLFNEDGQLAGGRVSVFLLEKTRVTSHAKNDRNFHIFYHLFAGLTDKQRSQILLDRPDRHRILRPADGGLVFRSKVQHMHHKAMFIQLQKLLNDVGFNPEDTDTIFAFLSAILHLTDIEFEPDQETDGVFIVDEYPLHVATELLGVPAEDMATALISNVNSIRGERIVNLKNLVQANDGRDALAKSLYSRLFAWIVHKINMKLKPNRTYAPKKSSPPVIGLLDIAGFENFESNSFEQLCINVSNEQLQHYFNQHIFAWEKKDLENEGVKTSHISFTNNSAILSMFIDKPIGVYALIDEESKFPKATGSTLLEKLRKHLVKHPYIKKEKSRDPKFTIHHYAGPVTYSVNGMLEKNRDTLSQNILECLQSSESGMIYELFSSHFSENGALVVRHQGNTPNKRSILMCKQPTLERGKSLSKSAGRKLKQNMKQALKEMQDESFFKHRTAGSQFQDSLAALTKKLMQSQPHFVRCIRPNSSQSSKLYENKSVAQQLKYSGILETVRIRHEGFPVRLAFHTFLTRYKLISFQMTAEVEPTSINCHTILRQAGLHQWEIGSRKVFLKYWHPEQLNLLINQKIKQVVVIQSLVRGFLGRRQAERVRQIVIARKQAQSKSFLLSIAEKCHILVQDLKTINTHDASVHRQKREDQLKLEQKQREHEMAIEEKRRNLALLEAVKEKRAAELRLSQAEEKIRRLANNTNHEAITPDVTTHVSNKATSSHNLSNTRLGGDVIVTPKSSRDSKSSRELDNTGTWRQRHVNHKEHVSQLRERLENEAAKQTPSPPIPHVVKKIYTPTTTAGWSPQSERDYSVVCPYGLGRKLLTKPPLRVNGNITNGSSREPIYESTNISHYARQSSQGGLKINKTGHYDGIIRETISSDVQAQDQSNWGKLVYMEKSYRCAHYILSEREVRIDGAHNTSDINTHIALNSVDNPFRDERISKIREYIGKGLTLRIDSEGDVWAHRLGVNDIIVQDHHDPSLICASADVIQSKGKLQKDVPVKIFDMTEFRSHVILEIDKQGMRKLDLLKLYPKCCIVSLTMVKSSPAGDDMQTPCWINFIHLGALRLLQDDKVLRDLEQEMQRIKRSNIDLSLISKLPSFVKPKYKPNFQQRKKNPARAKSPYRRQESSNAITEKIYATPDAILDRGAKAAGDIKYHRQTSRPWAKLKHSTPQ